MPGFLSKVFKSKTPQEKESAKANKQHDDLVAITSPPSRFRACEILAQAGIPSKAWLDDVSQHFGLNVILNALFIVVPAPEAAGQKLVAAGYTPGKDHQHLNFLWSDKFNIDLFFVPSLPPKANKKQRMIHELQADPANPAVCLLSAEEWCYTFPTQSAEESAEAPSWYPSLPEFVAAMFGRYLGTAEADFERRVRAVLYIQQIYIGDDIKLVREPEFKTKLPNKYWQLHSDQLEGINTKDLIDYPIQKQYAEQVRAFEEEELKAIENKDDEK